MARGITTVEKTGVEGRNAEKEGKKFVVSPLLFDHKTKQELPTSCSDSGCLFPTPTWLLLPRH